MMLYQPTILVVDDEPQILRLVGSRLEADGFAVLAAGDGAHGIELFEAESPDAVVLDLMMPDVDGLEVLQHIRERSNVPVVLLTARSTASEVVHGLNAGADDYVTKPFNPDELSARLTALLRRADPATTESVQTLTYEHLSIDLVERTVLFHGEPVQLTRTEWELLFLLARNPGRVMMRDELVRRLRGPEFEDDTYYLRTWISRLRSKIEVDPRNPTLITTYHGIGYRLEPPDTSS